MRDNNTAKQSLNLHKKLKGKIEVVSKVAVKTEKDLSLLYTPGVGAVSMHIAKNPRSVRDLTMKGNMVAVVSDGSAVLGLGNIGPEAALPVMEGKALLFKKFADVDAFPIVLSTQDTEEIIETVKRIAPTFGGINLEDISAPRCFEIEERLKKELSIPVMHDDQHGTAIVVLAGLINAYKVTKRSFNNSNIVINGAGAAGVAVARLIKKHAPRARVVMLDSKGIIESKRTDLAPYKEKLMRDKILFSNKGSKESGNLKEALVGADVFIGVSKPGVLTKMLIKSMSEGPIIFALANPVPEIMPYDAKKAGVRVMATGRSDFPNQVNNSLVFPGVFRGAFDRNIKAITDTMKVRAAIALAGVVKKPTEKKFIPGPFDKGVLKAVSSAIR